jgi:hypothetical protein
MKSTACCSQKSDAASTKRSGVRMAEYALRWLVPGVLLAAMPKCPLCLAAYFALFTGFGISLVAAKFAWWSLTVGCIAALTYVTVATTARRFARTIGKSSGATRK